MQEDAVPHLRVDEAIEIHYSDDGHGPAVLLLHGWGCDGNDWSWLAADLMADHRVIIVDHRGHGRSTSTVTVFGAKVLAQDAAVLLRHLSIDTAIVIGHSMGTIVASALAVEHPDLVSALVLADPVYGQRDDDAAQTLTAVRRNPLDTAAMIFSQFYLDASPSWLSFWHRRRLQGTPPSVITEALAALYEGPDGIGRRSTGQPYLSQRKCPILAIYSGVSADTVEWERALPHGSNDRIVIWPDNGHFLHQERPEDFAALTRDWLATLAQAPC
jgi:pimeloyl-ACP methyl ester carboxylesterase